MDLDDSEDEDLIGYDAIEPGLPPASSDRQRWWLENGKMAQSGIAPPKTTSGSSTTILNPSRPSNPFTPTDEPDWVAVPRGGSRLSSFSSISSSPYEHINHSVFLSGSTSSPVPRKLPPPHDAASVHTKFGRINLSDEQGYDAGPPPPPPRRQTGASVAEASPKAIPIKPRLTKAAPTPPLPPPRSRSAASQSSTKSKAPPPVAKKPAHLASNSPHSSPPSQQANQFDDATFRPNLPRRASTNIQSLSSKLEQSGPGALTGGMHKPSAPPLQPKRVSSGAASEGTSRGIPRGGVGLPGLGERKPVLPARLQQPPTQPAKPVRKTVVDLLGDDGSADMNGWETLRPN